ncbi:MAG: hypothetical protein CL607_11115 [Anaerolineaceae bacterium]|nr:hypothetical protein [Anaerolineaceae bacterium]
MPIIKKGFLDVALLISLTIASLVIAAAYSGESSVVMAQDRPLPTRVLPGRQGLPISTPMPIVPNATLAAQSQGQITLVLDIEPLSQVAWQQFRQAGGSLTQFMAALDAQNARIDALMQDVLAQAQAIDPQARFLFQGRWATVVVVIAGDVAIADALRGQARMLSVDVTSQQIPITPGVRPGPVVPSYPVITPESR